MSITFKIIILIVVIILIVAGIWWWFFSQQPKTNTINNTANSSQQNQDTEAGVNVLMSSPKDASDSALGNDLAFIDSQMKNFTEDSANLDQIVNSAVLQTAKTADVKNSSVSISTIINDADKEIGQRVKSLNDLIARISLMKNISETERGKLTSPVQNEIDKLTALKEKINADTSLPTAITDYQSITKSDKIYNLLIAQIRIIVAADKALAIVDYMNVAGSKVKLRVSVLTGINAPTINQIFSDFTAKIKDAGTEARSAANKVLKLQANTSALKDAMAKIKIAADNLAAARKDIGTIVQDLKEIGGQ